MDIIESANKTANNLLDTYVYGNPVISSVLSLFLVLYAGLAAPKLPKKIAKLFGNEVFRIIILVCIAYMASKDSSMSIISAVALVISLQTLTYHEANEVVAATISNEASKIQSNNNEEYVFDEEEEIPPVYEEPQESVVESDSEPHYEFSDEPISDEYEHDDHHEEPVFEQDNVFEQEPVSEPEPVMSTQSIEDEEPVDYQEPEVSETVSEPEPTAPVQHSLPQ